MYQPNTYGDGLASVYDQIYPHTSDVDSAVTFIQAAAPQGRVLELGVGTGRLAFPLADAGLTVHGVDASEGILAKLTERDAEGRIETSVCDFTEELPEGEFDVVLIGLNTLFMVPDRDKQIDALRLMRSRLGEKGIAIAETYDPWYYHRQTEARVDVHHIGPTEIMIDTSYVSRKDQQVIIVHTVLDGGAPRKVLEMSRYAWPSELELMARAAGLTVREQWGGWNREPVMPDSKRYVWVFEAADES
jgi:SAM-dependent methyltransferase